MNAIAVGVAALVHTGVEKLLDQVAVGGVQFNAVKTGFDRQSCGLGIFFDRGGDVFVGHGARRAVRLHALCVGVHLARAGDWHGTNDLRACGQVGSMRHTAGVHQLQRDLSALGVHRISHQFPAPHLIRVEQAGDSRIAQTIGRGRGALGDDQTG